MRQTKAEKFAADMMGGQQRLFFDYTASKKYCAMIGLHWLGDDWVRAADADAHELKFSQEQVDAAMRHHLWQVRQLFEPQRYGWRRILIAFHFLFGHMPPLKIEYDIEYHNGGRHAG